MDTYSVKDIAELLNTNPETVRRWIRSGKLKAIQASKKDGNVVNEVDLYRFLRSTSKYAKYAADLEEASPILALSAVVGLIGLGIFTTYYSGKKTINQKEFQISSQEIKQTIMRTILENQTAIAQKEQAVKQLQEEIQKLRQQNFEYEDALNQINKLEQV